MGCDEAQVQLRVDEFCRTDPVTVTVFKMCPSFLPHSFIRALGHMIPMNGLDILACGQDIAVCPSRLVTAVVFSFFPFPSLYLVINLLSFLVIQFGIGLCCFLYSI